MQRRIFAATAVSSLLLLAACAPSSDAPDPDDQDAGSEQTADGGECAEDVSLRVWSWRTEDADAYETIFDVFEEQNPCITVEFQAFVNTEYNQILQTGLTGSDGPDVAQVRSYGLLQPLVEGGNLVALDDIVPEVSEFDETILAGALGREDGQTYGVPFASQTLQMYYNTAIFEENGLEEPTTWEEFVEVNETLAEAGVTPMSVGGLDAWMMPIVHDILGSAQYGGAEFEEAVLAGDTPCRRSSTPRSTCRRTSSASATPSPRCSSRPSRPRCSRAAPSSWPSSRRRTPRWSSASSRCRRRRTRPSTTPSPRPTPTATGA